MEFEVVTIHPSSIEIELKSKGRDRDKPFRIFVNPVDLIDRGTLPTID